MAHLRDPGRRSLLKTSLIAGGLSAGGAAVDRRASRRARPSINMQLGWIAGGNQIGEVVAKRLGYLRAGRHRLRDPARRPQHRRRGHRRLRPLRGGPGVVQPVADARGRRRACRSSASPSARRSIPTPSSRSPRTRCARPQTWSARRSASRPPAAVLLRALLAKNKIAEKDVKIVTIGADMAPLLTGQVDVVTGWLTNTTALKVLGPDRVDLTLWDAGVQLYALPYYATTKTLETQADVIAAFLRATARGWAYATSQQRRGGRPAGQGVSQPQARRRARGGRRDARVHLRRHTRRPRAGARWTRPCGRSRSTLYAELGQFTAAAEGRRRHDAGSSTRPRRAAEDRLSAHGSAVPPAELPRRATRRRGDLASPATACTVRFFTERRDVTALKSLDLDVAQGEFLTLLGPSGCGKSTLLRVVADLLEPQPRQDRGARRHAAGARARAATSASCSRMRRCCPGARRCRTSQLPLQVGGGASRKGRALRRRNCSSWSGLKDRANA